jgi:fluoride exporter
VYSAAFPVATLCANLCACLLLGGVAAGAARGYIAEPLRLFIVVGVCGGFSTFSTFSFETLQLLQNGRYLLAVSYAVGSVICCVIGVAIGFRLIQ